MASQMDGPEYAADFADRNHLDQLDQLDIVRGNHVKKVLFWAAVLIGGYLVLENYKGFSSDLSTAGTGSVNVIKALQGR